MYLTGKLGKRFIEKMYEHDGHTIELVGYDWDGDNEIPANMSIECIDCHEVLIDADNFTKPKKKKRKK